MFSDPSPHQTSSNYNSIRSCWESSQMVFLIFISFLITKKKVLISLHLDNSVGKYLLSLDHHQSLNKINIWVSVIYNKLCWNWNQTQCRFQKHQQTATPLNKKNMIRKIFYLLLWSERIFSLEEEERISRSCWRRVLSIPGVFFV